MLQVHQLSRSFGIHPVLISVSFVVNDGERVALIGPNGAGKSTLLRCVMGLEAADAGSVTLQPTSLRVGYLPQTFAWPEGASVGEVIADAGADLSAAEAAVQTTAEALGQATSEASLTAYEAALERFEQLGGYGRQERAADVLTTLGLAEADPVQPVASLSGGQQTRLALALLLLAEPELLLLDEPTNHLDTDALAWLEGFVRACPGSVLLASHDRAFLDATVQRVLYLDAESHAVRSYPGNYSAFVDAREQEQRTLRAAWEQQQAYVARVSRDIGRLKSEARSIEVNTTARQPGVRKLARNKATLAKAREHKLDRYLASDERVDKPKVGWSMHLNFGPPPSGSQAALRMEHVTFGYPGGAPLFRDLSLEVRYGQRLAVVGPNGAGKTSLLRLIEGALAPQTGSVQPGASTRVGVLRQGEDQLDDAATVLQSFFAVRPVSETEARNDLSYFLFTGDAPLRRVGGCSPGERVRLQLALLVVRGCNLLLLDEPLNHLDLDAREQFEDALDGFEGTVVAVSHDRAFLRRFARRVLEVRDGAARVFEGPYRAFEEARV